MLIARAKGVASSLADILRPLAAPIYFPSRAMSLISSIQSANDGVGQSFLSGLTPVARLPRALAIFVSSVTSNQGDLSGRRALDDTSHTFRNDIHAIVLSG